MDSMSSYWPRLKHERVVQSVSNQPVCRDPTDSKWVHTRTIPALGVVQLSRLVSGVRVPGKAFCIFIAFSWNRAWASRAALVWLTVKSSSTVWFRRSSNLQTVPPDKRAFAGPWLGDRQHREGFVLRLSLGDTLRGVCSPNCQVPLASTHHRF